MRRVQPNLFTDDLALYRLNDFGFPYQHETFQTGWSVDSPATSIVVDDKFYDGNRFSIRLVNSTSGTATSNTATLRSSMQKVNQPYAGYNLIFNAVIYSETTLTVSTYLHPYDVAFTSIAPNTQELSSGVWNAIFSNEYQFPNAFEGPRDFGVTIVISGDTTKPVWFSCPNLTDARPHRFNQFVVLAQQFLPDIFRDLDAEQTNPTNPLMKIFHSLTENASIVMDEYLNINSYDGENLDPYSANLVESDKNKLTRSAMTDIDIMAEEYKQYMSMFAGFRMLSAVTVNNSNIIPSNLNFSQWQLRTKAFGIGAGTRDAMRQAIKLILNGNKLVLITPFWQGNPWSIRIRTLTSETPNATGDGQSSDSVLKMADLTKPAGYAISHETVSSISFVLNDPDFGVFDQNVLG